MFSYSNPRYKKETVSTYDKNAKFYAEKFDQALDLNEPSLKIFLSKLPQNSYILDAGAGSGTFAAKMKELDYNVVCLDNSVEMLKICASKKLQTIHLDMEKLGTEANKYDGVWSLMSLTHIPKENIDSVLENISKCMKREGVLFVGVHEGNENKIVESVELPGNYRHMSKFQDTELEEKISKYFWIEEQWKTSGYNKNFLQYIAYKY